MRTALISCIFLISVMFAGCSANERDSTSDGSHSQTPLQSASSTTTSSPGPGEVAPDIPDRLLLSDCLSVDTLFYGPTAWFSESMPPGWEESQEEAATELFLRLYDCQKLSWGPFERGPVTMMAEIHGSLTAAGDCLENHPYHITAYTWVHSLWFSDAEVADWVKTTYNAPVHYAEFKRVDDSTPALTSYTWSWKVPGGEESHFTMRDVPVENNHSSSFIEGWFWYNGRGISYIDASMPRTGDDASTPVLDGFMAPPMMYANVTGQGVYAAIADWYPTADLDGAIRRFSDLECTVPA